MPAVSTSSLSDAYERLAERLGRSAERAGRTLQDVEILAVTKNQPAARVQEILRLGLRQLAESRVQEAEGKKNSMTALFPVDHGIRWHLVGHLQSNKARRAVELFDCIQSVDSLALAEKIHKEGERRAQPVSCLIEVKVSPEAAKKGLAPAALPEFMEKAGRLSFLRIEGFMGMPPKTDKAEDARPYFRQLKQLFDRYRNWFLVPKPLLSMGMSDDCEVAVEEGSTMVRIGTALFGSRAAA
jgi:pyridoxal phosphate enzyme (YggS family)